MIYELRTYALRAGTAPDALQRWDDAYRARGERGPLVGFFRTEIGPLNELVAISQYVDVAERARAEEAATATAGWAPDLSDSVLNERVEIVAPFPFAPQWTPGAHGPIYELRQYTFRAGTLPQIMEAWRVALPERLKFSTPSLIGSIEIGASANSFIHLWPYTSLESRNELRAASFATPAWPPAGGRDHYLAQSTKILLPASFSPAQ